MAHTQVTHSQNKTKKNKTFAIFETTFETDNEEQIKNTRTKVNSVKKRHTKIYTKIQAE